ncbi:MAG: helix-turn-helix transcriptional regulator [Candidatus Pacebacteria bacterium]|nr:helix-turn-helix transcriptional regulator [Candidatus Paceibacterota bacterium]
MSRKLHSPPRRNRHLESAMRAKGMTGAKLAQSTGLSVVTISKILNGRVPRFDTAFRIAEALDANPNALGFDREEA